MLYPWSRNPLHSLLAAPVRVKSAMHFPWVCVFNHGMHYFACYGASVWDVASLPRSLSTCYHGSMQLSWLSQESCMGLFQNSLGLVFLYIVLIKILMFPCFVSSYEKGDCCPKVGKSCANARPLVGKCRRQTLGKR